MMMKESRMRGITSVTDINCGDPILPQNAQLLDGKTGKIRG